MSSARRWIFVIGTVFAAILLLTLAPGSGVDAPVRPRAPQLGESSLPSPLSQPPIVSRELAPLSRLSALGADSHQIEWRTSPTGALERWTLWHTSLPEAPWITTREVFPSTRPTAGDATPSHPAPESPAWWEAWAADRIVLAPDHPPASENLSAALARQSLRPEPAPPFSPLLVLRVDRPGLDAPDALVARLRPQLPRGTRLSRDALLFPATTTPNDPRFPEQWALPRIGAPEAWDLGTGAPGGTVVVAVADTGLDLNHTDLVPNLFTNPGEADALAANGVDDDGNGLIDDRRGWDWVGADALPQDSSGHGTAVAGLAAAAGNNALGITGTSWGARVLPLRIGTGTFPLSNLVQAIDYLIDLRARHALHLPVLNLSLGGPIATTTPAGAPDDLLHAAIQRARAAGLLITAAAGNDARNNELTPFYPASYTLDNVIAVGGTGRPDALGQDTLYAVTNYGTTSVDLAAPALDLVSTRLFGGTASFTGTSGATPIVTGAIAVALAQSGPLPYLEVRRALLTTVSPQPVLLTRCATGGRLDLRAFAQASRLAAWHIDQWGEAYTANPAAAASADPDADGDPNLLEYLRGTPAVAAGLPGDLDPAAPPDAARRETLTLASLEPWGDIYDFTYWRARPALHLPVTIETATHLTAPSPWTAVTPLAVDTLATAPDGAQQIRVRLARSPTEPYRFFRVVVTSP